MSNLYTDHISFFDRVLVAIHPVFKLFAKNQDAGNEGEKPLHPSAMLYKTNWLGRLVFSRFYKNVNVNIENIVMLKELAEKSTLVYVAKNIGQLEYNYLNHLFLEENLPLVEYTNALTLRLFMRWRKFWNSIARTEQEISELGQSANPLVNGTLPQMVAQGVSVLLTIPQSSLIDDGLFFAGQIRTLTALLEAQRKSQKPISVVPLDFLWSHRPEKTNRTITDILFGEKESPGFIRKTVLFWRNYIKNAEAVIGQPIDLSDFLNKHGGDDSGLAIKFRSLLTDVLKAQRFALTGPPMRPRRWFLNEVTGDETLDNRICKIAAERGKPADDLRDLAERYTKEIIADVDHTYIELADRILTYVFGNMYESFQVDSEGLKKVKELYAKGPVVFVPNHKSHVDYLILSHILYHNGMTIPHIAAGINLKFWPLGNIFRRCGAYFIRRSFRDNPLYIAVLETYLKVLLKEGYSQEFFIEGGRSRTGKLSKPRKGMLSMLSRSAIEAGVSNLNFIPVSITYDRVIEQKSYVKELEGANKEKERTSHVLGLTKYLKRQKNRFGSIYVNFGEPISAIKDAANKSEIEAIAYNICHQINRGLVVTPTAVAAAALLAPARRGVFVTEVKRNWEMLLKFLEAKGVNISPKFNISCETIMDETLAGFVQSKFIASRHNAVQAFYSIDESKRMSLAFFKNGITHFFTTIGLTSRILLKARAPLGESEICTGLDACKKLLFHEFRFATRKSTKEHADCVLNFLIQQGAIISDGNKFQINPEGMWICNLFARQIQPFIETLLVAFCHVSDKMTVAQEERMLVSEMMRTGEDLFLLEQVRYREAITKTGFENAIRALVSFKLLFSNPKEARAKRQKFYLPSKDIEAIRNLKAALEKMLQTPLNN